MPFTSKIAKQMNIRRSTVYELPQKIEN